jgi:hypothetical protein
VRGGLSVGFRCEINYILKLGKGQGQTSSLEEGKTYDFEKDGSRIYPVDAPIDLANDEWTVVARIAVRKFCVSSDKTTGSFEVLSIYDTSTSTAITQAIRKGEERNDTK